MDTLKSTIIHGLGPPSSDSDTVDTIKCKADGDRKRPPAIQTFARVDAKLTCSTLKPVSP